ncbi:MAG: DUF1846 domain-containing protein [Ruminococcaceae bacterium]|nr:DUF1846 domain-containing protein [Oscillospiraceae bacterium]
MKIGFDNQTYIKTQSAKIMERVKLFDNKLYIEFGGKLFDDLHAARVLPGFAPDAKINLLREMRDQTEIIIIINAADIERKKIRADFGITYDMDVLRLMDNLRSMGIYVSSVVITQYTGQHGADVFRKKLEMRGERVYVHRSINGYPNDVDTIVSEEGYGANDYIETTRPLVVVTAPGPGSGKLATCLSQLYHEYKRGVKAGYAKFETFPIWNLPLKHPVNIAYEAATADLRDVNMIDPYHLDAYGVATVNYNRDVEAFPVVQTIVERITGKRDLYRSPTDMGVNMVGNCIIDDEVCREAAKQEILRRYYKAWCDYKNGTGDIETAHLVELLMKNVGITTADRRVVSPALEKAEKVECPVFSIELSDGRIITGKEISLMSAPATALINAVKALSGIADEIFLLSPVVIEPIQRMKGEVLGDRVLRLGLEEVLIALSICAATNSMVELAMTKLAELRGCEAHSTTMLTGADERILRKLGLNFTCEPVFPGKDLFSHE